MAKNCGSQSKWARYKPAPLSTWKEVFQTLPRRFKENHTLIVAGGVAFYFFLSVFPGFAAIVSIYGLFTDAADLQQQMSRAASVLPSEAQEIIRDRLKSLIEDSSGTLEWQLVFSTLLSIWITNVGTRALFRGINIAYGISANRKSGDEIKITILFTIGGILFYIIALAVMIAYPAIADQLQLSGFVDQLLSWIKYPIFAIVLAVALSMVYRYAPVNLNPPYFRVVPGAVFATLLWILSSWLLSVGVKLVGVAPSYGPLAAVAILLLWFLLSSFVILLGAEINSALQEMKPDEGGKESSQDT